MEQSRSAHLWILSHAKKVVQIVYMDRVIPSFIREKSNESNINTNTNEIMLDKKKKKKKKRETRLL